MICNKCGATLNDDAIFCSGCGAKVEVEQPPADNPEAAPNSSDFHWDDASNPDSSYVPPIDYAAAPPEGKHVTIGNWVCRYLINFIPCVGNIAFLIMLFVWSFDNKYDETSRNWAKANLIICAIAFVLMIIVCVFVVGGIFMSAAAHPYRYTDKYFGSYFDMY